MAAREIYVSVDVETDGPLPGINSLLSIGCVAYDEDLMNVGAFSVNLELTPGAVADATTERWWSKQGDAYARSRVDVVPPSVAMERLVAWLGTLPGAPVFVAAPLGFDFMWVHWYLTRYATGGSPFGFRSIDLRSYAAGVLGKPLRMVDRSTMPRSWTQDLPPHTHVAVEDALEQGELFCNVVRHRKWRDI